MFKSRKWARVRIRCTRGYLLYIGNDMTRLARARSRASKIIEQMSSEIWQTRAAGSGQRAELCPVCKNILEHFRTFYNKDILYMEFRLFALFLHKNTKYRLFRWVLAQTYKLYKLLPGDGGSGMKVVRSFWLWRLLRNLLPDRARRKYVSSCLGASSALKSSLARATSKNWEGDMDNMSFPSTNGPIMDIATYIKIKN